MSRCVLATAQRMQMLPRQCQEPWGRPDILIQRITFLVGGDHLLALDVGEARLQLFQSRAKQFAQQFFRRAFRVHLRQRGQARRRFYVQVQDMAGWAQAAFGVLFPGLCKFANFHDALRKTIGTG